MVLSENVHCINSPVAHVFGHHEGNVTEFVLLIERHILDHLLMSPSVVLWVSQSIFGSNEHGNWNLRNGFNWNEWWMLLSVDFFVSVATIVEVLELRGLNDLSIVNNSS